MGQVINLCILIEKLRVQNHTMKDYFDAKIDNDMKNEWFQFYNGPVQEVLNYRNAVLVIYNIRY